jgi:hypothetical protein
MRLTGKVLQEIIGRADVRFSGTGTHRALGRLTVDAPATLFPVHDDLLEDPIEVMVQDISAETVGIASRYAMMPGSGLVVCLPRKDAEAVAVQCEVLRCNPLGNGQFAIGARFMAILDNEMLTRPDVATNWHRQWRI